MKDSLWEWVCFIIRDRKLAVKEIEDAFSENKFPAPSNFESHAESYLGSVATNETLDPSIRINAAKILGGLQYPIHTQKFLESFKLTFAYDEALSNFKKNMETYNATEEPLIEEPDERWMKEEGVEEEGEEEESVGLNRVEQWLSQTNEEFLNEQFEYSPVCKRCGKGKEGHRVIAVMGRKFADCITNPVRGADGEPWGG